MRYSTSIKALAIMAGLFMTSTAALAEEDKDTTVVVPETGLLPIKPSRNFTGPADITVCSCFGSNSSGLYFTVYNLNEKIIGSSANGSSGVFLVAKPGTYTLKLTDAEVTGPFNSTVISWQAEAGKAYKKDRFLYKYIVKDGVPGFQRDENYAAENYQYCDMSNDEHIYLPLAANNLNKIAELLNTTAASLQFIPFEGPWKNVPSLSEWAGINAVSSSSTAKNKIFDLQGRRVVKPMKGIYVKDNKKVIIK